MANFFAMGGYAQYVWPAYLASVLVLGIAVVTSLKAHARARKMVRQLEEESADTPDKQT